MQFGWKYLIKGSAVLSEKALIKRTGMSKGQVVDFLSLRILFIASEGEIGEKEIFAILLGGSGDENKLQKDVFGISFNFSVPLYPPLRLFELWYSVFAIS